MPRFSLFFLLWLAGANFYLPSFCLAGAFDDPKEIHLLSDSLNNALILEQQNGFLSIDGQQTPWKWPGRAPSVHRVSAKLFVLHDLYSGDRSNLFLWDKRTGRLTPVPGTPERIGGNHCVLLQNGFNGKEHFSKVMDIDPRTKKWRTFWKAESRDQIHVNTLGKESRNLFFLVNRKGIQTILVLSPENPPVELPLELSGWQAVPHGDAIRSNHLLLARMTNKTDGSKHKNPLLDTKRYQRPPVYEIGLWSLESNKLRSIGKVDGWWMHKGGFPDPILSISWITAKEAAALQKPADKRLSVFQSSHVVVESLSLMNPNNPSEKTSIRMALFGFIRTGDTTPESVFRTLGKLHSRLNQLGLKNPKWTYHGVGTKTENLPLSKKYFGFALLEFANVNGKTLLEKELSAPESLKHFNVDIVQLTQPDSRANIEANVPVDESKLTCGNPRPEKTSFPVFDTLTFRRQVFRRESIVRGTKANQRLVKLSAAAGGSLKAVISTERHQTIWFTNLEHPVDDVRSYWKTITYTRSSMKIGGQSFRLDAAEVKRIQHE